MVALLNITQDGSFTCNAGRQIYV